MKFSLKVSVLVTLCILVSIISAHRIRKLRHRLLSEKTRLSKSYLRSHSKNFNTNEIMTSAMRLLASEKEKSKQADPLDDEVLVDIQEIVMNSAPLPENFNNICSLGYKLVVDADGEVKDLNAGAGGVYIYLCQKYKKIADILPTEQIMNTLKVQIENSNCGNLEGGKVDLNKNAGGEYIYLCRGSRPYDPAIRNCPISNLQTISSRDRIKNFIIYKNGDRYKCLETDLNKGAGGLYIHLCYAIACGAPQTVEFTNLTLIDYDKQAIKEDKKVYVDEFQINNGSGSEELVISFSKSESKTTVTTTSTNKSIDYKTTEKNKEGLKTTFVNKSYSEGKSTGATKSTNANVACKASYKQFTKCLKTEFSRVFNIPHTYDAVYTDYFGYKSTRKAVGRAKQIVASTITSSACCYKFCGPNDKVCSDTITKESDKNRAIDFKELCDAAPTKKVSEITKAEVELDPAYNKKILVDLKLIFGDKDCPPLYEKDPTDLRAGVWTFSKVYLCKKLAKVSEIGVGDMVINTIRVQYSNSECGELNLVQESQEYETAAGTETASKTTEGKGKTEEKSNISGSDTIFLCYGNVQNSKELPISNVKIVATKTDNSLAQNIGLSNGSPKYLEVTREKNVPKQVLIKNYEITDYKVEDLSVPTIVDVIDVKGTSISKKIVNNKSTNIVDSNSFNFGVAVMVAIDFDVKIYSKNIAFESSYNKEKQTSTSTTESSTESQEITCSAPAGKQIKCYITKTSQRIVQSYKYTQSFIDYKNAELGSKEITGKSEVGISDNFSVTTCCVSGCCEGSDNYTLKPYCQNRFKDILCTDYEKCLGKAKEAYNAQK